MRSPLGIDWVSPLSELSEHVRFIRNIIWKSTPLGPPETWPQQLHQMVDLMMGDPTPAAVMWGDELTMIYNEAFVEFAGAKHPLLMGASPAIAYAEVWEAMFAGIIEKGRKTGQATRHKDVCLFLYRHGYLEECFVTYTFLPIVGADKTVVGFYHIAVETTSEALSERRTRTLLAIGDHAASARNINDYWNAILKAFESNDQDIPYVVAYHFQDIHESDSISTQSATPCGASSALRVPRSCTLAGVVGRSISQVPLSFDVTDEEDEFVQIVRKSIRSGQSIQLHRHDGSMPHWLREPSLGRAFNDQCTSALVMPIRPSTRNDAEGKNSIGFLVVGLNPRRRYDKDYERFTRLWSRQLATTAASILILEQEISRQEQLTEQLSISAKHVQESETRFSRFAEMSNVAM